jgi:hypothetical protein
MRASRIMLVLVLAACALLMAAARTTASPGGLKVMVAGADTAGAVGQLVTELQAEPGIGTVTTFDTSAGTPSASQLAAADIVVSLGSNYHDAATFGDQLATYVDHGGVVLQAAYDTGDIGGEAPAGRFASGGYAPLSLGPNDNLATTLGQLVRPYNPLVQGLGTFANSDNTTNALAPGATLLAKWTDGRNAIAVKGRVVATSASAVELSADTAIARLARNAGRYFPTTTITNATIKARAGTAAFRFRAAGVSTGFVCRLAKAGKKATFKSCSSHKSYSNLKRGRYTFEAAAVGLGGPDPTPAKKSFTITR